MRFFNLEYQLFTPPFMKTYQRSPMDTNGEFTKSIFPHAHQELLAGLRTWANSL
jgi:hypothetical protein